MNQWIPATTPPRLVGDDALLMMESEEVLISDGKRIRVGFYRVWRAFDDDLLEDPAWVVSGSDGCLMYDAVAWMPLPDLPHESTLDDCQR
jgi:hypothetical protein